MHVESTAYAVLRNHRVLAKCLKNKAFPWEKTMQNKRIPFLPSALALALATAFAPAYAQDPTANDTAKVEEAKKAQKDSDEQVTEVIEVKGLRSSLAKAQELKMESDSFIDAIVAEDIGKMPDVTAAESLARITGVQVTRWNDEASAILIRGLPDVTTTYNGREFFTAEGRRAQLQDFPSQALASIEVYKSGTADLIEPGLAGLVNVNTRRPFDFEGQKIGGGVHWGYNDQSEKSAPSANILYSNRWDTKHGEVGFLANATYAAFEYYNGVRYNDTWFPQAEPFWNIEEPYQDGGFVLPNRVGLYNSTGKRWRPSWNMSAQWQATPDLQFYFDGIYQGFRGEGATDNFNISMTGWDWLNWTGTVTPTTDVTLTNITMVPDSDDMQAMSLTKSGGLPPEIYRSTNKNRTDTYQYAIGFEWNLSRMKIESDFAYTDSTYRDEAWSFDTGLSFSPEFNVDFFGDGGVLFETTNWDVADINTYEVRGYYESDYDVGGAGWQWRTDLTFDTGWGDWLHTIQTGVRLSDRDAYKRQGSRYAWLWDLHIPVTEWGFLDMQMTKNPFRTNEQGFTTYLAPTRSSIAGNHDKLAQLAYEATQQNGYWEGYKWANDTVDYDPNNDWHADEKTYAFYVQARSFFEIRDIDIDVFYGVRIAKTESETRGISTVRYEGETSYIPRTANNDYIDVLPNISVKAALTEKLQLRLGYTETHTKPNFADLNPVLNIDQLQKPDNPRDDLPTDVTWDATGWGGNPDLKSLDSKNYDASIEWYFSETGFASAAAFYRDLFGFINNYTRLVETPDYGTVLLSRPENSGEGEIRGYELSFLTFFDFDNMPEFMHAFGVSANTTYLTGKNRIPDGEGNFGEYADLPGLSKNTYNFAVFYEKDAFSARLSYNLRDQWVNWYGNLQTDENGDVTFSGNQTKKRDRLDFSMSYAFSENFTAYVDVANILANPFHNYTVNDAGYRYTQDIRDEGRYFGAGFRFNF